MSTIIAVNTTGAPIRMNQIPIPDNEIPALGSVTLSDYADWIEIQTDEDLKTEIDAGNVVLSDGLSVLSTAESSAFCTSQLGEVMLRSKGRRRERPLKDRLEALCLYDELNCFYKFDVKTGKYQDHVSGEDLTAVNSPPVVDGLINDAIGVDRALGSHLYSADKYLQDDAETLGLGPGTTTANPFTLCAWVWPDVALGGASPADYFGCSGMLGAIDWIVNFTPGNHPAAPSNFQFGVLGSGLSTNWATLTTNQAYSQWHFIVCRYYGCGYNSGHGGAGPSPDLYEWDAAQGGEKRISLVESSLGSSYISEDVWNTGGVGVCLSGSTKFWVGQVVDPITQASGRVDCLGIWRNRVLSDAECLKMYDLTSGITRLGGTRLLPF